MEQSLQFQRVLYDKTGREYPGSEAFKTKLNECTTFVQKNAAMLEWHHGKKSFQGAFQQALSVFDESLPRFREALAHNVSDVASE